MIGDWRIHKEFFFRGDGAILPNILGLEEGHAKVAYGEGFFDRCLA